MAAAEPKACPLCRRAQRQPGRYIVASDAANLPFVYSICQSCRLRLDRLPAKVQRTQEKIASQRIADQPEKYDFWTFTDPAEARMFCYLAADLAPTATEKQ